jgi:hypothetical protein
MVKTAKNIEKTAVEFNPIGEKWVAVRNIPEGARIMLPK